MNARATSPGIPRLLVAGTSSGVGKTLVMLALVRALSARGLSVAVFKCGPDYLDPTYHARAAERTCHNLDGWMMGEAAVRATFERAAASADIALIEGVMGLFDGASPHGDEGSSAEIAKWLDAPVLLVVDAGGMARSLAALVHGFSSFDPALSVAGVVCNRVGSRGHLELLRRCLTQPPIVGGLPLAPELALAERHLGLVSAGPDVLPERVLDGWRALAEAWLDLDALLALATPPRAEPRVIVERSTAPRAAEPRVIDQRTASVACRIAVAHDEAFHFYYEDNLRRLESLGAELVEFSPLSSRELPEVSGVYLGGGYPELYAARLHENRALRAQLVELARKGAPVYGECGGLMYLCEAIETTDGARHPMLGLLPGTARMHGSLCALGYVEVETSAPSVLGARGLGFRGHQFRYSELVGVPDAAERVYRLRRRRDGEVTHEGYRVGSVLGSYVHAHWASNPNVAAGFVAACRAYAARAGAP